MSPAMERDPRIGAYAIGARDGNAALIIPPVFSADVFNVFFEADEAATEQIRRAHAPARSRVLPYCLGDRNGPGTLLLNHDPYTSSLLRISADLELAQFANGSDYPHAAAGAVAREMPVELRTLDSLDLNAEGALPPPTIIMVDTQGSELQIMRGGRNLIGEHTVAIITEVEFVPIYQDQPLFGDVSAWLSELGFFFADFQDGLKHANPFGMPLGQRGRPLTIFSDALFFRRPETIAQSPALLAKLAFTAIVLGYTAVGFRAFDLVVNADPTFASCPAERAYFRLLIDLTRARAAMPEFPVPTFTDLYPTFDSSNARFDGNADVQARTNELLGRMAAVQQRILNHTNELKLLISPNDTPVEQILRAYGLQSQAEEVKRGRLDTIAEILKNFGVETRTNPAVH